jgi:predicted chitinase
LEGDGIGRTLRPPDGLGHDVSWAGKEGTIADLKLNERTGNVYENKGSVWKTRERSGNVIDNK